MKKKFRRRIQNTTKRKEAAVDRAIGIAVLNLLEAMPDYPLDHVPTPSVRETLKFGVQFTEAITFFLDRRVELQRLAERKIIEHSFHFYPPEPPSAPLDEDIPF